MDRKRVIIVTDGDMAAKAAVEKATENIGGLCISASAGNPTVLTGKEIILMIKQADHDPVVVMADDKGAVGKGSGEQAMEAILGCGDIKVLGIVAVSSNGKDCYGLKVNCSVNRYGEVTYTAVNKNGENLDTDKICGDTLSILKSRDDLFIVGIGDPGKMLFSDDVLAGSPITTKAFKLILEHNGIL